MCYLHARLIHIFNKCDCLLHLNFWTCCNNNLPELNVLFLDKFFNQFFIANGWLHVTHTWLLFFHGVSCSCDLLKFIFIIYVTFFFQMFHVNMLQHLFWAYFHFNGLFIVHFIVWKTFFFFMLFCHYFLIFHITSLNLFPPS